MYLPLSRAIVAGLDFVPEAGSTNAELVARASAGRLEDFAVLATTNQTAGKGRMGRSWVAPPGRTIAVSVLLRPDLLDPDRLGWLPLIAGLAMTRAVAGLVDDHRVTLKWPNDVQIDGLKVAGLLAQLVPSTNAVPEANAVVIGAGLNLTMTADELPTPTSTSLTLNGVAAANLVDRALAGYLGELRGLYDQARADGIADIRAAVIAGCSTIGRSVRVELPDGDDLYGSAVDIDELGRLVVSRLADARLIPVAAGDVTHLRYE